MQSCDRVRIYTNLATEQACIARSEDVCRCVVYGNGVTIAIGKFLGKDIVAYAIGEQRYFSRHDVRCVVGTNIYLPTVLRLQVVIAYLVATCALVLTIGCKFADVWCAETC